MAKISLKTLVYGSIGLLILFILASTIMLPYFRNTYEHGFGTTPCNRDGCESGDTALTNPYCVTLGSNTALACTSCNASAGYEFFLDNCGKLNAWNNATHCTSCASWGFKTSTQGLILLVLVIGLIMFAAIFIPRLR